MKLRPAKLGWNLHNIFKLILCNQASIRRSESDDHKVQLQKYLIEFREGGINKQFNGDSMGQIFRVGQILTSSKIADRYLKVRISKPIPELKKYGNIYFLIEITSPLSVMENIGNRLIELITNEYFYKSVGKNLEERFESALKKANLHLADLAQANQSDWVGKLNAVIAVLYDEQVIITNAGNAQAYLFRSGNFNQVIEPEEETPPPMKTFSTLVSGEFKSGDKLLICNNNLIEKIPFHTIRQNIVDFDPILAVNELADSLKQEKTHDINTIIIESVPVDKATYSPPVDKPSIVYLDKKGPSFFEKIINRQKKDDYTQSFDIDQDGENDEKKLLIDKPVNESIAKTIKSKKGYSFKKAFFKTISNIGYYIVWLGNQFRIGSKDFKETRHEVLKENMRRRAKLKEWESFIEKPVKENKTALFFKSIVIYLGKLVVMLFSSKNRKILIGFLIVIAIIVIFFVVKAISEPNASKGRFSKAEQDLVNSIEQKITSADASIKNNKKDSARKLLIEAQIDISKLPDSDKKNELNKNVIEKLDIVDGILRVKSFDKLADLKDANQKSPISLLIYDNGLYSTYRTGSVYLTDFKNKETKKVGSMNSGDGNIIYACDLSETIAIYSDKKQVYEFTISDAKIIKNELLMGQWPSAQDMACYADRTYLLSDENNQVYKYSKIPSGWQKAKEAVLDETDITLSDAITIDGDIWLANIEGQIMKFTYGIKDAGFSISGIPAGVEFKPIKIFTLEDLSSIFALDDKGSIWQLNKQGQYQRKIVVDEKIILSFLVNADNIYFMTNNEIGMIKI